ncbi:MAG: Trk system potassium transporter TrkA, partial [Clostridia bacterium]|nr:Trk system potassium transporter TrkA [Clostridia bacterium]MDD4665923.1 Trk system potassium transporter TrkA [Clostridia bacterium]
MRVIIIGAGKIGFNIAKILVEENYDVVIIEKQEERAKNVQEYLDVEVFIGNGATRSLLEKAGVEEAVLLVAVTESDEVNMIACMVGKTYGVEKTIARVRNPEYAHESRKRKDTFPGIDFLINPELVTAKEVAKLIDVPEALDVVYYAEGKIQLLELKIPEAAPVAHQQVKELKFDYPFLIVAIVRKKRIIIPRGDDVIYPEDIIFVLAKTKEMIEVERLLGTERKRVERVMIFGGNYAGYHLAKILENKRYSVKIIEKEYNKCVELAKNLDSTMVLYGDATDIDFLTNEGTGNVDVFVCLTDDDKLNLLVSLIVKNLGVQRTIAQVRRSDYVSLLENVGIDVGISPRTLTANKILRFIHKGDDILSVTLLSNENAEMTELLISKDSPVANKKLKNLNFPHGSLIGSIYRKNQVIIPKGDDILKPGDSVTVFALPEVAVKTLNYITG